MSATPSTWRPLTGGTAIWVMMAVEVATFGMFLLYFAWSWVGNAAAFLESQAQLHLGAATFGTVLLLLGSFAAYQGVLACEGGRLRAGAGWMVATAVTGLAFSANKLIEYSHLEGVGLSTNAFWFSYLFLTGIHLLHVLAGVGGFAWLAWRAWSGHGDEGEELLHVEAGAAYWHLVDVIWLLLLPILYGMRP